MHHHPLIEPLLPTPAITALRRRKYFGRFRPSSLLVIHELQRAIKLGTRNARTLSKNKLADNADVDRHLIMRILRNEGLPELLKANAILGVLGSRLGVVKQDQE